MIDKIAAVEERYRNIHLEKTEEIEKRFITRSLEPGDVEFLILEIKDNHKKIAQLQFMVDNGLGAEDMRDDFIDPR